MDQEKIRQSIYDMEKTVQEYVPNYKLKQEPVHQSDRWPVRCVE